MGAVTYDYDDLGRLWRFHINDGNSSGVAVYSYDNASNLRSQTGFTVTDPVAHQAGHTYPSTLILPTLGGNNYNYDANNRVVGWQYDASGRLFHDDRYVYIYNELNQISEVQDHSDNLHPWCTIAQYLYDAEGNRVREVYEDRIVYSIRGLNNELITQETHIGSERLPVRTDYIYHNGSVLAEFSYAGERRMERKYTFRDRLGSPVVELTGPGFSSTFVEYSPYGHQMRTGLDHPRNGKIEFTGHEHDANTKLDYMSARYYDPTHGRFNRPDPAFAFNMLNPVSFNLYAFVYCNPVNYIDPQGNIPIPITTTTSTINGHFETTANFSGHSADVRVQAAKAMIGTKYKQETEGNVHLRTGNTAEALEYMDCSEFVSRVLAADKLTSQVLDMNTKVLREFLNDTEKFEHSSDAPKVGDIAVWDGHVGVVTGVKGDKIKLTHAAGEGKKVNENTYFIPPKVYRPAADFFGYYRPKSE